MANTGDIQPGTRDERKTLTLSAVIIAAVAVFCAFITGWRIFSAICAVVAIALAVFCISKSKKTGTPPRRALWALGLGIFALLAIGYHLLTRSEQTDEPGVINEPVQEIGPAESQDALNRLQQVTADTVQNNQP